MILEELEGHRKYHFDEKTRLNKEQKLVKDKRRAAKASVSSLESQRYFVF